MSNFLKHHLQQGHVDSSCQSPAPIHYRLGSSFYPPEFRILEEKPRGRDVLAPAPQPGRHFSLFEAVIQEVEGKTVRLINP